MKAKDGDLGAEVIHEITQQITNGLGDMMKKLIIHRDLKLSNVMIHFPNESEKILLMDANKKQQYIEEVDLEKIHF